MTNRLAVVLSTAFSLFISSTTWAQSDESVTISIEESQSLSDALQSFADQTDLQVIFFADITEGKTTSGVEGEYQVGAALDTLLADTGLSYTFIDDMAVSVQAAATDERGASDSKNSSPAPVLMAQNTNRSADTETSSRSEDVEQDRAIEEIEVGTRGQIETIVVVGSRNAGIRRYEDDAQPYVVFEAAQLESSFANSVEEFLKNRLPMNAVQATNSQLGAADLGGLLGNQSTVNLRGLGANQTLILVNGRRMPSVGELVDFGQPDINGIPLSAIERIEVLPTTAAGIWGGGATGGAINIILKGDYTGMELSAGYENSFESDTSIRRLEASAGFSLENGRTNVTVSASYSEANPLFVGERGFSERSRALLLENNPDAIFAAGIPPLGLTTNIRSLFGDLFLDDGTPLGSPFTSVPIGYPGVSSDGGAGLIANAGTYNLALPDDATGSRSTLLSSPTKVSALFSARREFSDSIELFLDASLLSNDGESFGSGPLFFTLLPPDIPSNPFTTPIFVAFPSPGISIPNRSETNTLRGFLGGKIALSEVWTAHIEFGRSESRTESTFTGTATTRDFFNDIRDGTLDVIRDLNVSPLDVEPYLFDGPTFRFGPVDTVLDTASVRVSGTLFDLPGGPLNVSGLIERRTEELRDNFRDTTNTFGETSSTYLPSRKQRVNSIYVEVLAPLVSSINTRQGVRELEVQLAARHDDYATISLTDAQTIVLPSRDAQIPEVEKETTNFSSTDYTIGLRYSPVKGVLLRASYGTGFLPPSINQVVPFASTSPTLGQFLVDPKRGGVPGTNTQPIESVGTGNPDLVPEKSDSWSYGVILSPKWLPGLRFSADYTRIEKTDEIAAALSLSNLLELEDQFPDRVVRAPLTDEDIALGYKGGEILLLDTSLLNVAESKLEAFDFQLDYSLTTLSVGTIDAYIVATYQTALQNRILPQLDSIDRVGFVDGPLDFRGNVGVGWTRGPLYVGWNAQYFDDYYVFTSTASPDQASDAADNQGSAKVGSQIYHDLFARYSFGGRSSRSILSGVELEVGIQNILDKRPPTIAGASALGGYSLYGDPRLRRYSVNIRKVF